MAYWINKSGNASRPNWKQFYCDNTEDVAALPSSVAEGTQQEIDSSAHKICSVGSECLVIGTSDVYVLSSSNVWTKL